MRFWERQEMIEVINLNIFSDRNGIQFVPIKWIQYNEGCMFSLGGKDIEIKR